MTISIQSLRDNAGDHHQIIGDKTVFFTIEYDSTNYKWHGNIPLDADAQEFLDAKSDTIKAEILRKLYREAVVPQLYNIQEEKDGNSISLLKTPLESFEAWVSAGCKNAEVKGEDYEGNEYVITPEEVIEKKAWVDTH